MTLYSHSRITTFESCPYKYKLKYIDRVEVDDFETVEQFLGSRVHDALEKLYKDLSNGKELSLEELLEYYEKVWEGHWSPDIVVIKKDYTPEHYRDKSRKYSLHEFPLVYFGALDKIIDKVKKGPLNPLGFSQRPPGKTFRIRYTMIS